MEILSFIVACLALGTSIVALTFRSTVKGEKGDTGAQGVAGPQGATGEAGPRGPQGFQGLVGEQGERGTSSVVPEGALTHDDIANVLKDGDLEISGKVTANTFYAKK